jgi:polar amino acid transport system permease protein
MDALLQSLADFWKMVWPSLGYGLLVTLRLSVEALFLGLLIGMPIALARVYGPRWLGGVTRLYTDLFRGTPLLVQLFLIYYGLGDPVIQNAMTGIGLPPTFLTLDRNTAALIALALNSGAYQAEYFRGALQAIGSGQMIAARALGMNRVQAILHVILPQAMRLALAPWSNEAAYMVKYTSIVSLITVQDLFGETRLIMSRNFNNSTMLPFVGMIYLVIVLLITWLMSKVENRFRIPGLEMDFDRN